MMKDKNLEVGKKYKNLKLMCEVLGLVYKDSTNSRKANLKEIECYYKLEKQGRAFIVEEKYNVPQDKTDKRKNNGGHLANTKYNLLMDDLLINWLYENDEQVMNVTFNQLFGENKDEDEKNIPILNNDYKDLLDIGYEQFAKEIGIRKDLVDVYTEKLRKIIIKCLETALGRLQKQKIITWQIDIMVKYFDLEVEIADEKLTETIKQKEQEVYNDEEINITPFQRKNPSINKRFKREVIKKLTNVASYWKVYTIEILDWDKIIKINDINEIKKELTNRFIKSILNAVLNKKYGTKVDNPGGIGKIRINEYHPFDSMESLENINELDKIFFVDYQKKDWVDTWAECLGEELNNEESDDEIWS